MISASTAKNGGAATPHVRRRQALPLHHQRPTDGPGTAFQEARRGVSPSLKLFVWAQTIAPGAAAERGEREEGQTMAEYSVALTVITIAVIGAISLLSDHVLSVISTVSDTLTGH